MIFNLLKKTQYRDATDCVSNIINHCRVETHSMRLYKREQTILLYHAPNTNISSLKANPSHS
jgi:hypothetical protein